MKRILALALCLVLMLGLAACRSNSDKDNNDSKIGTGNVVKDDNEGNKDAIDDEADKEIKFSRGKIKGNTYTSNFANIKFKKTSSWEFLSDKEILEATNLGADLLGIDFEYTEELLEKTGTIIDVIARAENGNNVTITCINTETTGLSKYNARTYLKFLSNSMESMGYEVGTIEAVTFAGENYKRILCKNSLSGIDYKQVVYVRKIEKYMFCVVIAIVDETDISEIESMFS